MSQDCIIRRFETDDLPRLHEIRNAAFVPVFKSLRAIVGDDIAAISFKNAEQEQADFLDRLCGEKSDTSVFVAERYGELGGFCTATPDTKAHTAEIDLVAVHPDHQGHGITGQMLEHVFDHLRGLGIKVAHVGTGGDPSHAPARRVYEKAGFGPALPNVYYYRKL